MTFEPVKVLHSVLEFYYSSGIVYVQDNPVTIKPQVFAQVHGLRQRYEQLLFFVLGHLLPEFAPLTVDIGIEHDAAARILLNSTFILPHLSRTSFDGLKESIDSDDRLRKLLVASEARIDFGTKSNSSTQDVVSITYPISAVVEHSEEPVINFDELKKRYDSPEISFTLLEGFVMNARRHLALLTSAAEKQEWAEAHRHAHALKGGALNVAAEPFARKARIIEAAIKEKRYEEALSSINQLERVCTDLEAAWAGHREELNG